MLAKTSTTPSHGHSANGPVICQNCDHEYVGRYCSQCGQRADTHRINWHYIWHDIPHSIFHYDSGILFTLSELITRPGYTIREFLNGKRVKHYRPLALLIILAGIEVFAAHSLNIDFVKSSQEAFGTLATTDAPDLVKVTQQDASHFVQDYQKIIEIVLIPLNALWFWLLFRRRGYNYPEMLVAQTFIASFNIMATLILMLLFWVLGSSASAYTLITGSFLLVMIAYNAWVYVQLFKGKLRTSAIFVRSTSAFLLSQLGVAVMGMLIVFVYSIASLVRADANGAKSKQPQPTTVQKPH